MYFRFNKRKVIDELSDSILVVEAEAPGQAFGEQGTPDIKELFVQTFGCLSSPRANGTLTTSQDGRACGAQELR